MALPDFIYAGTSRSGSTWIYNCLLQHPEILMPDRNPVRYFNLNYHRGVEWYNDVLPQKDGENKLIGEASPGYMKNPWAPQRISDKIPDAKLIFCLRNPIERAYSEWWQGYTQGWHNMEFDGCIYHHMSFDMWLLPGFYHYHLSKFDEHFKSDQIEVLFFDNLKENNSEFASNLYSALSVDDEYKPSIVGERSNQAPTFLPRVKNWGYHNIPDVIRNAIAKPLYYTAERMYKKAFSQSRYEEGIEENLREELERIYLDDIKRLSNRVGRDLNHWLEYHSY
jgi:hypothetical protein